MSESLGISQGRVVPRPDDWKFVRVDKFSDDYGALMSPDEKVEVWLTARPKDRIKHPSMVISFGFASYENANLAGKILSEALELVQQLSEMPGPAPETCEHDLEKMRFSRKLQPRWICRKCLSDLGEVTMETVG